MEYLASRFLISRFFVLDDAFLYSKRRLSEFAAEFRSRIERNPRMSQVRLFVMARPETIDEEVIDILATLNVICIQIGLQTVNPALQHYMKRTVDTLHFHRIRTWMAKHDMKLQLDIVVGLPGDTADWMKETLRFALLLSPFSMQIKQFYLNPNTLFHVDRKEYGIEIDTDRVDFDAPYVIQANGINERYFEETNAFIMEQINDHPQVLWKYLSKKQRFLSGQFYRLS
jgi:coproporphyrinogen III oxidase-like Fe-S oxidoreductase